MSNCLLCHTRLNTRNLIYLDQLLVQHTTLCDAINQLIQFNILPLDKPTTSQVSCRNCFNAFKSFYQFLHKVKSNLRPVKAENFVELPAYEPVRVCTVKIEECPVPDVKFEPVLILDGYQALNNELDSGQDTPSSISNQNPRMDSSRVESDTLRFNSDILSTNLDNYDAKQLIKSENSDTSRDIFESINMKSSRRKSRDKHSRPKSCPVYLPKSLRTREIFESGQEYVSIDGVEYKVPKKKPKELRELLKLERQQRPPRYAGKTGFQVTGDRNLDKWTKYPQHDVEGEAKIKKYVNLDCYVCGAHTGSFIEFKKHFRKNHKDQNPYLICCGKQFLKRHRLMEHLDSHERVIRCEYCNKISKTESTLKQHIRKFHAGSSTVQCKYCNKVFQSELLLKDHLKVHFVDEKTLVCYKCDDSKIFKNLVYLKAHLQRHQNPPQKTVCHICSKMVTDLNCHMEIHKERKRIQCGICSNLILENIFKRHMRRHAAERSNGGGYCEICRKFLKSELRLHVQRIHEKNYSLRCPSCGKGFFQMIRMQEHIAVHHTQEYLFQCRVEGCGTAFRNYINWKKHEKTNHPEEYERYFKPKYKAPEEVPVQGPSLEYFE